MRILFLPIVSCFQIKTIIKPNLKLYHKPNEKLQDYLSLIRYNNILPTALLNISGGLIINPSIKIFSSIPFIITIINTFLITSSSMIINDLYDFEIDKINNPTRPLVTGKININEAKYLTIGLLSLTEILTFIFLNKKLNLIIQLAIINIIIYTPILKKITLIKNISCALLISFAPIFSGLALNTNNSLFKMITVTSLIFLGSLYCEILLDIRDREGDKKYNIKTIPVLFGNDKTFYFAATILFSIIIYTRFFEYGFYLWGLLIFDLYRIKKNNYLSDLINKVTSNTHVYLFSFILLYLIKTR
jgi:4-hydroxybenzoate polyprenyltransferase